MTKKQVAQWAKIWGYTTAYSGKTRTMYVEGITHELLAIIKEEWNLTSPSSFNLSANY